MAAEARDLAHRGHVQNVDQRAPQPTDLGYDHRVPVLQLGQDLLAQNSVAHGELAADGLLEPAPHWQLTLPAVIGNAELLRIDVLRPGADAQLGEGARGALAVGLPVIACGGTLLCSHGLLAPQVGG